MSKLLNLLKKNKNKLIPMATCVAGAVGGEPAMNAVKAALSFLGL